MADSRAIARPIPGYWRVRLAGGAPWTAQSIQWETTEVEPGELENLMERSPILTARINGEIVPVDAVWLRRGEPITQTEHDFLVALVNWSVTNEPFAPHANPGKRVDFHKLKPIF